MIEAAILIVAGALGLWLLIDMRDLERSEAEYRRQREAFEKRMHELFGENQPPTGGSGIRH